MTQLVYPIRSRDEWAKNPDSESVLRKGYTPEIKAGDEEARTITFVISTGNIDRHGDTIDVKGWRLSNFRKNPVVLFGHDSSDLPIGKATSVGIHEGKLVSTAEFATRDVYPFADTVYQMIKGGFLNATSVGFLPHEWAWSEDHENRPWGIDFTDQELLEWSIVPIPGNAEALGPAKAKGIDLIPLKGYLEQRLDLFRDIPDLGITRDALENMYIELDDIFRLVVPKTITEEGESITIIADEIAPWTWETVRTIPRDVSADLAEEETEWAGKPRLADFSFIEEGQKWTDLDDATKIKVARHYGYSPAMPPKNFGDLALPHHDPATGKIVLIGVQAAMASLRRGSSGVPEGEKQAVYQHLVRHYRAFDLEPPELEKLILEVDELQELVDEEGEFIEIDGVETEEELREFLATLV